MHSTCDPVNYFPKPMVEWPTKELVFCEHYSTLHLQTVVGWHKLAWKILSTESVLKRRRWKRRRICRKDLYLKGWPSWANFTRSPFRMICQTPFNSNFKTHNDASTGYKVQIRTKRGDASKCWIDNISGMWFITSQKYMTLKLWRLKRGRMNSVTSQTTRKTTSQVNA